MNETRPPSTTIADWVDHHAETRPQNIAFRGRNLDLTWRDVSRRTQRLAARLLALRVQSGDRVSVLAQNRAELIEIQIACARVGAIFSPLNTRMATPELQEINRVLDPVVLFYDELHQAKAEQLDGGVRRIMLDESPSSLTYETLISTETSLDSFRPTSPDDDAVILFTSGTTGQPLGVVLTHAQLHANHRQFLEVLPLSPDSVNYAVAPLFHVAGLNTITGPLVMAGGTSVFAPAFDPGRVLEDFEQFDITCTFMVPTMWRAVASEPSFEKGSADQLDMGLVGGARCPEVLSQRYLERAIPLYEGYGLTEAGPMVTLRSPISGSQAPDSVGEPGPDVKLRIRDENGDLLGEGETGELEVRAPNVMARYWRNPSETSRVFSDRWLATGDVGYLSGGTFHLLDRADEMIKTGGEQVYPSEVESALESHPGVSAVAVVATDDPHWGQAVTAVVVPAGGQRPNLASVRAYLRGILSDYKLPTRVVRVDQLPTNGTGKVVRREVLRRIESDQAA